ncbi:MAG TPA: chemotaxis protein CheB [bacterium]
MSAQAKKSVPARAEEKAARATGARSPRGPSHIVGIGASAGGLEAFEKFFQNMPPDSGLAFVLVPHLDPTHKSIMTELLERYTKMPVQQAEGGMKVSPNRIYVIPPNKELSILNGALMLLEPKEVRGLRHPIDSFFRALAADQKERAICVVLSGTGTEGTLGLRAIKGEGGLVIVQDPATAKYDGMPTSAVATGIADYVLAPEKMPERLLEYVHHAPGRPLPAPPEAKPADLLQKIFILIRVQTGHDFSQYKQNTVMRRIERRMAIHQVEDLEGYAAYLRNNPHEIEELFKELLIRVTNFFREPEAFAVLQDKVLPLLFKDRAEDAPLRVWVPGCCTGEEAYSIAILFLEHLRKSRIRQKVQIFATDIDIGAIETARAGVYPESITVDVSPERLARFFVKHGTSYKIKEEVREIVVFAVQSVIKDPPFSKVDLVSCRNLLIYLSTELQRRIIPLFHYALAPEGFLLLGSSESVGEATDLFAVVDKKWKVFRSRRLDAAAQLPPEVRFPLALEKGPRSELAREPRKPGETTVAELTTRLLLEHYSPPCALVNERGDILYVHGRTGKYLEPAPGKATLNILDMAREGLRLELRTALRKTHARKTDQVIEGVQVRTDTGYRTVNIGLRYVKQPEYLQGLVLVVFHDVRQPKAARGGARVPGARDRMGARVRELEFELKGTREHLQTVIEEQETTNEELKSMNEELQSSNEELQSTNEELETSKEELQSVNEELVTVNSELQNKIDELSQINNDMSNLLASTQIATIFLDSELKIKRFTPAMIDVFNLIQGDIGRPLSDIVAKIDYPDLVRDAESVIRTLSSVEKLTAAPGGRWFLARIIPYRTGGNVIDGVVLTFTDVTEQRTAQEVLRETNSALGIVETLTQPLLALDGDFRVLFANKAFLGAIAAGPEAVLGHSLFELDGGAWKDAGLRERLRRLSEDGVAFEGFVLDRDLPRIGRRRLLVAGRQIRDARLPSDRLLLAIEDVTGRTED